MKWKASWSGNGNGIARVRRRLGRGGQWGLKWKPESERRDVEVSTEAEAEVGAGRAFNKAVETVDGEEVFAPTEAEAQMPVRGMETHAASGGYGWGRRGGWRTGRRRRVAEPRDAGVKVRGVRGRRRQVQRQIQKRRRAEMGVDAEVDARQRRGYGYLLGVGRGVGGGGREREFGACWRVGVEVLVAGGDGVGGHMTRQRRRGQSFLALQDPLQNPFSSPRPPRARVPLVPAHEITSIAPSSWHIGVDCPARRLMTFRRTSISARRTRREILRLIRRINQPRFQIRALLAERRAFKCDGPGLVYITSRVPYSKLNAYLQGHIRISEFLDALEVKVGHTRNMRRRQCAYRLCAKGIAIRWHVAFRARKRILSEAIAHLLLRDMGAVFSVFPCPGCKVSHREYVSLRSVGSFNTLVRVIREAIRMTGQLVTETSAFEFPTD
ncbi:hypothetical protein B0H11DRAFT_1937773 [Mycena galericulata]|nr:hypothetical protein B0H11DRAFT_1937773 [Mycena galericulata]